MCRKPIRTIYRFRSWRLRSSLHFSNLLPIFKLPVFVLKYAPLNSLCFFIFSLQMSFVLQIFKNEITIIAQLFLQKSATGGFNQLAVWENQRILVWKSDIYLNKVLRYHAPFALPNSFELSSEANIACYTI